MADYERVGYGYGLDRLQSAPDLEESADRGGGSAQYSARDGGGVYSQQQQQEGGKEGESDSIKVRLNVLYLYIVFHLSHILI